MWGAPFIPLKTSRNAYWSSSWEKLTPNINHLNRFSRVSDWNVVIDRESLESSSWRKALFRSSLVNTIDSWMLISRSSIVGDGYHVREMALLAYFMSIPIRISLPLGAITKWFIHGVGSLVTSSIMSCDSSSLIFWLSFCLNETEIHLSPCATSLRFWFIFNSTS